MTEPLQHKPGYFGDFGGRFVPEALFGALDQLERAWEKAQTDDAFQGRLDHLRRTYGGRPTPITLAERLSEAVGREVWLKREDLAHTGSHKLNNVVGQALLAVEMGKPRVIAETGAGQHGVATATAAALFGLECVVYMGAEDCRRQRLNVIRMQLLGAEVRPVTSGTMTLKDAINEAMRDWVTNVDDTHYLIGSAMGPHPFPLVVRELQRVISVEAREQFLAATGTLPDAVLACVGGGSNAIGAFAQFIADDGTSPTEPAEHDVVTASTVGLDADLATTATSDPTGAAPAENGPVVVGAHRGHRVRLVGVEAGGEGATTSRTAATITAGSEAVLHGARSIVLVDDDGQVQGAHSVSAGLDYPGVGPEHAHLARTGRAEYVAATDTEALEGFRQLSQLEGIIPALEPAHVIGWLLAHGRQHFDADDRLLVNLSGRGDKDVDEVVRVADWDVGVPEEAYAAARDEHKASS